MTSSSTVPTTKAVMVTRRSDKWNAPIELLAYYRLTLRLIPVSLDAQRKRDQYTTRRSASCERTQTTVAPPTAAHAWTESLAVRKAWKSTVSRMTTNAGARAVRSAVLTVNMKRSFVLWPTANVARTGWPAESVLTAKMTTPSTWAAWNIAG